MAYNIDSTYTYSNITSPSNGFLGGGNAGYGSFNSSGWNYITQSIPVAGIYLATITVQFFNSPKAFVYIALTPQATISGVPSYNTGLGYNVGTMSNYSNTSFTGGNPSGLYSSYQVLAGSLVNSGGAGASAGLTTTAPFYTLGTTNGLLFLINNQTNNSNVNFSWSIIRIG